MLRALWELASWLRTFLLATSLTLTCMIAAGAAYILFEPGSSVMEQLEGTADIQKVFFLSREGLFVWLLTIDPDRNQLFLLNWVLQNLIFALALIVLGLGLWAEGGGYTAASRAYLVGGSVAGYVTPYLYRVATTSPQIHPPSELVDPNYIVFSALPAVIGLLFGYFFFSMRGRAIARRLKLTQPA